MRAAALGTLLLLAHGLLAEPAGAQSFQSDTQKAEVLAADGAGDLEGAASATQALSATAGQGIAASTSASTSQNLDAGYGHVRARPAPVLDLAPRADIGTSSAALAFTTPGYDGGVGKLQAGTRYLVRVASYTVPDTFSPASAQISISTSGTAPGDGVGIAATGLLPNTTYFAQLWTEDAAGNGSFASNRSTFTTLALAPTALAATFLNVYYTSATAAWAARPASPPDASSMTAEGYVVECSSTDFGTLSPGGLVSSSATLSVLESTLTVSAPALVIDKDYYFRVGALNWAGAANYTTLGSTKTLFQAQVPSADDPPYPSVSSSAITAAWLRNGNLSQTSYELDVSTASNFSGTVTSSTTYNLFASTAGLKANTTYFFRVDASSRGDTTPFYVFNATATLTATPQAGSVAAVWLTSASVTWLTGGNPVNLSTYSVAATTTAAFPNSSAGNLSLSTAPAGASPSATLNGLTPATAYSLFVAGVNVGGVPSPYAALGTTVTLAEPPSAAAPAFSALGTNGFTLSWGANGNPGGTDYTVEVTTSATFDPGAPFDVTADTAPSGAPSYVFSGLQANTTYFARVQAVNPAGARTAFVVLGSTSTTALPPSTPDFTQAAASSDSLRLDWSGQGDGPGTLYATTVSTDPSFAAAATSAQTSFSAFASTSGLSANATYYFRVQALGNAGDVTAFLAASTATLADVPAVVSPAFSGVTDSSFTLLWGPAGNPVGITTYTAQISADAGFFAGAADQQVLSTAPAPTAATFSGLTADTTYFARARGVNFEGGASAYAVLGSTSSLAAAPAASIASVQLSSIALSWSAETAQGFEILASSTNFGSLSPGGVVSFSTTADGGATSLAANGLLANTTYFLVARSLNWNGAANSASVLVESSLALPAAPAAFTKVYTTSATISWTARPASPSTQTAEGYQVEASSAPAAGASDFTGDVFFASATPVGTNTLTVENLLPGTTYTFRLGTFNWGGALNYVVVGTSQTGISPFTWIGGSGSWYTTTNWSPTGTPDAGSPVTIDKSVTVTLLSTDPPIHFSSITLGDAAGTFSPVLSIATTVAKGGSVLMHPGSTLTQGTALPLSIDGDWTMESGSLLNSALVTTNPENAKVDVSVTGIFDLRSGAAITSSGLGFAGGALNGGSGSGYGFGRGSASSSAGGSGAGHGSAGGAAGTNSGGTGYDSALNPVLAGSGGGGGDGNTGGVGGRGGGAVIVSASEIRMDGSIAVDGAAGAVGPAGATLKGAGGGGSGGSVNLSAAVFSGAGSVSAVGGSGGTDADGVDDPGGGGAGGIVSISISQSGAACGVSVSTAGGASGGGTSGAGGGGLYSSTTTLAAPVLSASNATTSSLDWSWTASLGAASYQLFSSTGASGASPMSPGLGAGVLTYTTSGLSPNTTYSLYARAAACGSQTDSAVVAAPTAAAAPAAAAAPIVSVDQFSVVAAWDGSGNPVSVTTYSVVATTETFYPNSDDGNVVLTTAPAGSSLSAEISGLFPNTTYTLFVQAVNHAGAGTSFATLGSTATLARAPSAIDPNYLFVGLSSITARWAARPSSPSSSTCEGYVLEASTTNFGALSPGGNLLSTRTYAVSESTLSLAGIDHDTTWYFRVASVNPSGARNYTTLTAVNIDMTPSTMTLTFGSMNPSVSRFAIAASSVEIVNTGSWPITIALWGSTATPNSPWSLGVSSGIETPVLEAVWNSAPPSPSDFATAITVDTTTSGGSGGPFAGDENAVTIPVGSKRTLWFMLWLPTSSAGSLHQALDVGLDAVYP